MVDEADAVLAADARTVPSETRQAVYVGLTGTSALVDMGGERFAAEFATGYIPTVGETVRIWAVADQYLLLPGGPRPAVGTVLTVSGTKVLVEMSTGTVSMAYVGTAPKSGDRVGVVWSEEGPWCAGVLSTTPLPPAPPPPPPPPPQIRSATFMPIDAGSTDRGSARWWTSQPWASDSTFGAWFYGTQIKDTIPDRAEFVSLEFYVSWQQRYGGMPRFALHDNFAKGGVPGYAGYVEWAPGEGFQTPPDPAGWFHALKAGGPAAGVGLNQGGWNIFSSLAQSGMSGALRMSWRI